jgi:hypothetical protein
MNQIKYLLLLPLHWVLDLLPKEPTVENKETIIYTEEQLMARLKFFIGICLSLTLFGIVFVVLYSLIFVTQPLNAISPIDQKFFELIVPIATFLTGTLSGIMLAGTKPEDQKAMLDAQKLANDNFEASKKAMLQPPPSTPAPSTTSSFGGFNAGGVGGGSFNQPATFGGGFNTPTPDFAPQVVTGFGGKPMPVQPPQPEL